MSSLAQSIVQQPHEGFTKNLDPFLTPLQQRAFEGYQRLEAEAARRGWSPASVISLHPFAWPVTGPVHQADIKIPAIPLSEDMWEKAPKLKLASGLLVPFAQYVFTMWRPSQRKYLIGQLDYEEVNESSHIWPLEQAQDAVHQNSLSADRGGVFCYEGSHPPLRDPRTAEKEQALFEEAFRTQMVYYESYYTRCADAYMSRQTTSAWRDLVGRGKYHRWIALYLYRIGRLKALPSWYEEIVSPGQHANEKCDSCKQNVEPGSVICRHCNRVLKPFEAFAKYMIDADTPGARLSAKRCKETEIKVLVENDILTLDDLKAWGIPEPKGVKKPGPKQP